MEYSDHLAYIVGVALGDGNLSCPNGRATRLRITCDSQYPKLTQEIISSLKFLFPKNKVSIAPGPRETYYNISVYSNKLNDLLPWKVGAGSKFKQRAQVPSWIKDDQEFIRHCLRGLIQTDGSIYIDRGYRMVNFTNITEKLCDNVYEMMWLLGHKPHRYKALQQTGNYKYTVRLSKNVDNFISEINLTKA